MVSKVGIGSVGGPGQEIQKGQQTALEKGRGSGFADALKQQMPGMLSPGTSPKTEGLKFSNHAVDRIRSRGIALTAKDLKAVEMAVEKAAAKGSKNTLVLNNDSAWIVNVDNKTVVTVMDQDMLKENVFTNIDSTIVI